METVLPDFIRINAHAHYTSVNFNTNIIEFILILINILLLLIISLIFIIIFFNFYTTFQLQKYTTSHVT